MNNDYLWNKTGNDADIERCEDLLTGLRYTPVPAPETKRASAGVWWWKLIPIAAAAFTIVAVFWIDSRNIQQPKPRDVAEIVPVVEKMPLVTPTGDPKIDPRPAIAPAVYRTRRPVKASRGRSRHDNLPATLTAEEKYAYERALLALSMTGSQLQTVRDRIHGIEGDKTLRDQR